MIQKITIIITVVCLFTLVGCSRLSAASQVLGQKAEDTIIKQIGELDVQRQEAMNAVNQSKEEIKRLQRIEAENQVEADTLSKDMAALRSKKEILQKEMNKLADYMESGKPLTLDDGTVVSAAELESYAKSKIADYQTIDNKVLIKQDTLNLYQQNVKVAHERWTNGKQVVTELESQLELIDANIAALKVYQSQPDLQADNSADVMAKAKEVVDGTLKILEKERMVHQTMTDVQASDTNDKIGNKLQQDLGLQNTNVISTLRSLGQEPTK
jgi:predicted transcriptional regulator